MAELGIIIGTQQILPSSPRLKPGDSYGDALVLRAFASVGSCFTERLYYAASPQALHRAHPSLGLATEGSYYIRLPHA